MFGLGHRFFLGRHKLGQNNEGQERVSFSFRCWYLFLLQIVPLKRKGRNYCFPHWMGHLSHTDVFQLAIEWHDKLRRCEYDGFLSAGGFVTGARRVEKRVLWMWLIALLLIPTHPCFHQQQPPPSICIGPALQHFKTSYTSAVTHYLWQYNLIWINFRLIPTQFEYAQEQHHRDLFSQPATAQTINHRDYQGFRYIRKYSFHCDRSTLKAWICFDTRKNGGGGGFVRGFTLQITILSENFVVKSSSSLVVIIDQMFTLKSDNNMSPYYHSHKSHLRYL